MSWLLQWLKLLHKPTQEVEGIIALARVPLVLHVRKGHLATAREALKTGGHPHVHVVIWVQ